VKADPFLQLRLLDIQDLDSHQDQLRHRLATLPQQAELQELTRERAAVEDRARDARIRVDDLGREQRKADAEVEQVKARRKRDQDRMDQGLITSPKDLERMQGELVSLERRIATLEDAELEVMEQLETAQQELDRLTGTLADLGERIALSTQARDRAVAEIEAELAAEKRHREERAEGMPEDLMGLYDRLRQQKGGVGAAGLRARRCEGCSLQLNASDLGAMAKAPSDEVLRCEECSRILVRTVESGV
jgi:predicted  nucleic acid-binding Zn-ribbon protein